jgi:hypothetical protein
MQESVQDLQEDTQSKLNQMWDALVKRMDSMDTTAHATRAELLKAVGSNMQLIKDLGDTVERLELTDFAELGGHVEQLAQALEEEQTAMRQLIEDRAEVCCMRAAAHG